MPWPGLLADLPHTVLLVTSQLAGHCTSQLAISAEVWIRHCSDEHKTGSGWQAVTIKKREIRAHSLELFQTLMQRQLLCSRRLH